MVIPALPARQSTAPRASANATGRTSGSTVKRARSASESDSSSLSGASFLKEQVPLDPAAEPNAEENKVPVAEKINAQQDVGVQATEDVVDTAAVIAKLKKSAFVNVAIAIALGLFFVAALAAAIASGGLATPVAAMAFVAFGVAVGDAGTAVYNWLSKKGGGEELPMKGDSIGNLYYLVVYCIQYVTGHKNEDGLSDKAKNYIRYASGVSRFLIGISSIALGSINTVILANTIAVSTMVGPASTSLARSLMECINLFLFVNSSEPAAPKHMEARNRRDEHGMVGQVPAEEMPAPGR